MGALEQLTPGGGYHGALLQSLRASRPGGNAPFSENFFRVLFFRVEKIPIFL